MTTITVTAPDISCGGCVSHIQKDVNTLEGVLSVTGDIATKQVTITFDESKVSREQIAATMVGHARSGRRVFRYWSLG
jgi:copper chaperone CopZ